MTAKLIGGGQHCQYCRREALVLNEWRSSWLCASCYRLALSGRFDDAPISRCDACGCAPSALRLNLRNACWYCVHCGAFLGLKTRPLSDDEMEDMARVLAGKCK